MIHNRAGAERLPFGGAQMDVREEGDYGHAAKFHENAHPPPKEH
jgi:hypothetical protein